ncbi:hypothetical protein [Polynucleobacter paneuropaeus]|uniref:hypothetical protein n=1 Tax=Polynucleobacter paneuropaeus TaxID=2527775 RepID=UPI00137A910B|nr:hypothetical protein [Polynucleobacter paneuropaeus]
MQIKKVLFEKPSAYESEAASLTGMSQGIKRQSAARKKQMQVKKQFLFFNAIRKLVTC